MFSDIFIYCTIFPILTHCAHQEFDNIVKLSVEFLIPAQEKYMIRIMSKKFFKDQDANGNGNINFPEFLINATKCDSESGGNNENSEMCKIFLILDQDANGYISKEELTDSMELDKISNEEVEDMFKGSDLDIVG